MMTWIRYIIETERRFLQALDEPAVFIDTDTKKMLRAWAKPNTECKNISVV